MSRWKDTQEEQSTMHLLLISIEYRMYVFLCTLTSTIDCNNHIQTGLQAIWDFHGISLYNSVCQVLKNIILATHNKL